VLENKKKLLLKTNLHPRNLHRERYDFKLLSTHFPPLSSYIKENDYGDESIDFFNPLAVLALNQALLKCYYKIDFWELPPDYLCPPIPGRADYIHYLADILGDSLADIRCLDIGVGANCIYPILGIATYNWNFVGSDFDSISIANAQKIANSNSILKDKLELRLQTTKNAIFHGIIKEGERFDITLCNPPFHCSANDAEKGSARKINNLKKQKIGKVVLNFGGQSNELWCDGGEEKFVLQLISESKEFANSCLWFSTLISKKEHLKNLHKALGKVNALEVKTIQMSQGNKISHLLAWTFVAASKRKSFNLTTKN